MTQPNPTAPERPTGTTVEPQLFDRLKQHPNTWFWVNEHGHVAAYQNFFPGAVELQKILDGLDTPSAPEQARPHPDVNEPEQVYQAIRNMQVLGGHDRSWPEPQRYIEPLSDYMSDADIAELFSPASQARAVEQGWGQLSPQDVREALECGVEHLKALRSISALRRMEYVLERLPAPTPASEAGAATGFGGPGSAFVTQGGKRSPKPYKQFVKDMGKMGMSSQIVDINSMPLIDMLILGNFGGNPWDGKKPSKSEIQRLVAQNGLNVVKSDGTINTKIGKVTKDMFTKPIADFPDELTHPFGAIGFSIQLSKGMHYGAPITFAFIATQKLGNFTMTVVQ